MATFVLANTSNMQEGSHIVADGGMLAEVRHYASLKFSISEIATILLLDPEQLRRQILSPSDPLHVAYESGKLLSQVKYREKILEAADGGHSWAIGILEHWAAQQLEEELGGYA